MWFGTVDRKSFLTLQKLKESIPNLRSISDRMSTLKYTLGRNRGKNCTDM